MNEMYSLDNINIKIAYILTFKVYFKEDS